MQWVPVTTAWRVLRLRIEERPPIRRVAANILNKQSRTADEGWSSSLGVGRRPRRGWVNNIRIDLHEVGCGYMDWIGLAQDRDRWRTLVSAVMNLRVP